MTRTLIGEAVGPLGDLIRLFECSFNKAEAAILNRFLQSDIIKVMVCLFYEDLLDETENHLLSSISRSPWGKYRTLLIGFGEFCASQGKVMCPFNYKELIDYTNQQKGATVSYYR